MIRIIFACHGNICRSPMAEFILKHMVAKQGMKDQFHISSAATSTEEIYNGVGNPMYPPAQKILTKHAIPYTSRRATQLKRTDYDNYDYLIGMDFQNIRNIERITGHRGDKIHLLLDFAGSHREVADPWYTGNFEQTYQDIVEGCSALLQFIQK